MAKFDEMSLIVKVGILALVAGIVGAGFYFWPLGPMNDEIKDLRAQVAAKRQENEMLKSYVPKLADLNKQIAQLQEQLAEEKKIVPDEKEADLLSSSFTIRQQPRESRSGVTPRCLSPITISTLRCRSNWIWTGRIS